MWPLPRVCCRFLFSAVRKKREGGRPCAVAFWAALLGFGSVGFEIRLLRVSGLTVRKIAFQMLIFTAVGLQIRPSGGFSLTFKWMIATLEFGRLGYRNL